MKNLILFALLLTLFTSCKKKYNCFCSTTIIYPNSQDYFASNNKPISEKMNKKQAKAVCDHEAENINDMYTNYWTNNGNFSANGTSFHTQCSVE